MRRSTETRIGPTGAVDYRALIEAHRVHGSLYTDPRLFADEITNRGFWRHYRDVMVSRA